MNKTRWIALTVCVALTTSAFGGTDKTFRVENPRCEYLREPMAIETLQPRLSWVLQSEERGQKQTAYRVLVASSLELLAKDNGELWDSGKVESDRSIQVVYAGKPLIARQRCFWKVQAWDRNGKASDWSEPTSWTMGLLKSEDWRAQWISLPAPQQNAKWIWSPEEGVSAASNAPAEPRYFVKTIALTGVVVSADIRIACDNIYELHVNGRKLGAGSNWMTMGSYNISTNLTNGTNVIAVMANNTIPGPAGLILKGLIGLKDDLPVPLVSDRRWRVSKTSSTNWLKGELANAQDAQELGDPGMAPWNDAVRLGDDIDNTSYSPWLRKTFDLAAVPERATAYVESFGYHELFVNGAKVGSNVLSPAVTLLKARSLYVTYDIAPLLRPGRNCIGLWLGQGWAHATWGDPVVRGPMVRLQADIVVGGTNVEVVTDGTWKGHSSSYITLGKWVWNEYGGERYDARLDEPAWCAPDYDDRTWNNVQLPPASTAVSQAQPCRPNRIGQRLPAVACEGSNGTYSLDFGTNLAGWLRLRLPLLTAGQKVTMNYSDGYTTYNQLDEFISAGRTNEEFCSKFNYHGFRQVTVAGLPTKPALSDAEALLIESDLESAGSFECSNDLFNRIYRLNVWTIRCLDLGGYIVDCPHRERFGYGDGQVAAESSLMNFRMPDFYAKWLQDWRDGQDPKTGALPMVAPVFHKVEAPPIWGGALPTLAWRTYLYYGDSRVLEENYEPACRFVNYLETRCSNEILRAYGGTWSFIGDWVAPGRGLDTTNWPSARANEAFNNCYRVYLWELLQKSAAALGRTSEVQRCQAKLDRIRPLIHAEFYDPQKQIYVLEDQAYQCMALATGVTPASERAAVMKKLEDGILVRRGGHLDTGMYGTYALLQYLPTVQRDDLLFTIVNQKTYPGWGHMLESSATTIWEQWNGHWSRIHSCFTSVAGWFSNGLAGIQPDPAAAGFKKFIVRPAPVGDLTWVKCSYRSIHGMIVSNWKRENGVFTLDVTIPANTTATVYVPTTEPQSVTESGSAVEKTKGVTRLRTENGCAVFAVESGKYSFSAKL